MKMVESRGYFLLQSSLHEEVVCVVGPTSSGKRRILSTCSFVRHAGLFFLSFFLHQWSQISSLNINFDHMMTSSLSFQGKGFILRIVAAGDQ